MSTPRLIVVDDHPTVVQALTLLFRAEGWSTVGLGDPTRLVEEAAEADLVLLDMNFSRDTTSGQEGIDAMRLLADAAPELPVILMTAWGTVDRAVEAMKLGARDYVTKPWDNARLLAACRAQLELRQANRARQRQPFHQARQELDRRGDFAAIRGDSPELVRLLGMIADVAPTDATVLISGPPGTGKELVAEAIFKNSRRRNQPFVRVHVGALPDSLFERELFGHVRGAFTDAREDQAGRFAIADGGTLFLDEIGTLKPEQQIKLLRVLQEGEFEPLGSTRTRKVDVRVIAATNADLDAEMAAGRFREDLYYRLQVVELRMTPLKERAADVMPCARHFLRACVERTGKAVEGFSPEAEAVMLAYAWPGNVRELENAIERAVIFCRGRSIEPSDLPLRGTQEVARGGSLADLERMTVKRALDDNQGNISKTALALGLSRAALYRRLAKFGLD